MKSNTKSQMNVFITNFCLVLGLASLIGLYLYPCYSKNKEAEKRISDRIEVVSMQTPLPKQVLFPETVERKILTVVDRKPNGQIDTPDFNPNTNKKIIKRWSAYEDEGGNIVYGSTVYHVKKNNE